jgi:hypothetical protein
MEELYGSGAYTGYPVMLLFYETDDRVLVLDMVTLDAVCLLGSRIAQGEPFTLSIQLGPDDESLTELLRRWVSNDEVLHLSFEPDTDGGRMVLENASVMVVLRAQSPPSRK